MHSPDESELYLSSSRASGGLNAGEIPPSLWQQVDAFRELLQAGEGLLGEVLVFTRSAEQSLAALGREKAASDLELDRLRRERDESMKEVDTITGLLREREAKVLWLEGELARRCGKPSGGIQSAPVVEEGLQLRLRSAEQELEQTRLMLAGERLRRNRAISLIRPSAGHPAGKGGPASE